MTNGKMVWKNGPCCWYFSLNILGWPYKKDIKAAKMVDSNDVLAFFCSYDYDANTSEEIGKITTDEKDYHKCSLTVMVFCITAVYHQ